MDVGKSFELRVYGSKTLEKDAVIMLCIESHLQATTSMVKNFGQLLAPFLVQLFLCEALPNH